MRENQLIIFETQVPWYQGNRNGGTCHFDMDIFVHFT